MELVIILKDVFFMLRLGPLRWACQADDFRRRLWCGEADSAFKLHSIPDPAQQVDPFLKRKGMLTVENHTGVASGLKFSDYRLLLVVVIVFAHQKQSVSACIMLRMLSSSRFGSSRKSTSL